MRRLVFTDWLAESYRKAGYVVTEIRPGTWEVTAPGVVG
jgi:hypothetical protein